MNTTKLTALIDLAMGKFSESIGRATGNEALQTSGCSRKLHASLEVRRAQAMAAARVNMDAWRLADTRLRVAPL